MQNIKLDLPAHAGILSRAADFLKGCAEELNADGEYKAPPAPPKKESEQTPTEIPGVTQISKDDTPPPPPPGHESEAEVIVTKGTPPSELFQDDAPTVEVDAAGMPWDERIHSSGKDDDGNHKKLASGKLKGTWTKRRGVADELVAQVEAELKASLAATEPLADDESTVDAGEAFAPPPPPPSEEAASTTPPPPPPAQTTTPAAEGAKVISNFPELMSLVVTLKGAGKITDDQINAEVSRVAGVASVALMPQHEDKIPALGAALQALGA